MEKNGRSCLGKRNRAIDLRFFAVQDNIKRGEMSVEYKHTNDMVADFLTKPLGGQKIQENNFRYVRKFLEIGNCS